MYAHSGCTSGTTIVYSYACSNTSDPTKNLLPTTFDLNGGSIAIADKTYVGNYVCTVSATASTDSSVIDSGYTFSVTAKCYETLTPSAPLETSLTHQLGTV